jgi:hypothetical protein
LFWRFQQVHGCFRQAQLIGAAGVALCSFKVSQPKIAMSWREVAPLLTAIVAPALRKP